MRVVFAVYVSFVKLASLLLVQLCNADFNWAMGTPQ